VRIGDVMEAAVSELQKEGVLLRFGDGEGFLPRTEASEELRPGQRLLVKVMSIDGKGRPIFSQKQVTETDRELFELQREAERMRRFLRERCISPPGMASRPREVPVEERLARWMAEAERTLERLRRRRSRFGLRG